MDVSRIKMFFLSLWGGKEAVADYLLDIANNAVQKLIDGNKEKWDGAYSTLTKVAKFLDCLGWVLPKSWVADYNRVAGCIETILLALEDGKLTSEEAKEIGEKFRLAYAGWRVTE